MSYLIKNQVFFNNSWRELNNFTYGKAFYPVKVSEKLSEELDSGELHFYTDSRENGGKEMFYPQKTMFSVSIDVNEDKTSNARTRTFYFYGTDEAEKLNPYLWKHRVLLVEPTKDLEGVILDGLGFAQPEDNSKRMTLYDIVQRLLKCTPFRQEGQPQKYTLISETQASEIIAILKSQTVEEKLLPEFFWSSQTTLKEALCDIGAYANLYPRLTLNPATNEYTVITFDEVNKVREFLDGMGYVAEMVSQNDEQYVSELETNAQNVISKSSDTNTIVYPSPTGWITPRSDEVKLESENAKIKLPININRITKVKLDLSGYSIGTIKVPIKNDAHDYTYDANVYILDFDITEHIVTASEHETLKAVALEDVIDTRNKSNTLYYQIGQDSIDLGGKLQGIFGFKAPVAGLLVRTLINKNYKKKNFGTLYFIVPEDCEIGRKGEKIYFPGYIDNSQPYSFSKVSINSTALESYPSSDIKWYKFRIEYEPLDTSSKFRVSKSLPVDKPFIQNYNQRAEINSAEALGRNMKGTVNKMGVPTKNHLLIEQDLSKVPHVGDAYEKDGRTYIVSQIDYDCFSLYGMGVNLTLSQDWNMLSQYVGIDRRFRWEQIYNKPVERNLFYQDYLVIVPYGSENKGEDIYLIDISNATDVLTCPYEERTEVNNCFFYRSMSSEGYVLEFEGVVLSASSYATGGAMIFTAKTQDNLSAGKMMQDNQYCIDCYYCDADGTLDGDKIRSDGSYTLASDEFKKYMDIRLTADIYASTLVPDSLPEYSTSKGINLTDKSVGYATFYVDKNSSEQLNFVYELSWVSPCPYLVVGEKLAANNPLVRQWTQERKFRFVRLKKRLPQGTVKVTESYMFNRSGEIKGEADGFFQVIKESNTTVRLKITDGYLSPEEIVGWAITDENYGLYLASNDKTKIEFHIISSHEYHGKTWETDRRQE